MDVSVGAASPLAARALDGLRDGDVVGLGSGRAASDFVRALGARARAGLRVRGVPTSRATAALAARYGVPLTTLEEAPELDLAVDGADEVDPQLDLVKGWGGALLRERSPARNESGGAWRPPQRKERERCSWA